MKSLLLKSTLLLCLLQGMVMQAKADELICLAVNRDNSYTSYKVSDIQKLTFDAEHLYLTLNTNEVLTMPFSSLSKLVIEGATGINMAQKSANHIIIDNGSLNIRTEKAGTVTLHDTSGKTLGQYSVKAGDNSLTLDRLPSGIYIIKVNGTAAEKIMNK